MNFSNICRRHTTGPGRRWDKLLKNVPGLKPGELWSIWRKLRTQRKGVIPGMDPVSNLIPLAPESREEWLAAQPKPPAERLVAAS